MTDLMLTSLEAVQWVTMILMLAWAIVGEMRASYWRQETSAWRQAYWDIVERELHEDA